MINLVFMLSMAVVAASLALIVGITFAKVCEAIRAWYND